MATTNHIHTNGHTVQKVAAKHPLEQLSESEVDVAREAILKARQASVAFRNIFNFEPPKAELVDFLGAEHSGASTTQVARPARRARVQYDVVTPDKLFQYMESTVDLDTGKEVDHVVVAKVNHHAIIVEEFKQYIEVCTNSKLFQEAMAEFQLPEGFEVTIDPWPYGGTSAGETHPRYMQGLCYARDITKKDNDTNHYGFPLPIIPVMDVYKREIVRIDKLATGGTDDGLAYSTGTKRPIDHCKHAEYMPHLLDMPMRSDLKPLNVLQPEGASFKITDNSLIEWSGWRLRLSFSPRECAVLHDIHYQGRSIIHRLSVSEMTVPYGDPRPPFHRKQAFDFGDAGALKAANNLQLGCDCLGVIQYIDAMVPDTEGKPTLSKHVVCVHEIDDGLLYKHTNFRTGNPRAVRNRMLVMQFMITLANYEYIFAFKLDLAGGITVETRATGIVSVVNIDPGKTSPYGNVVSPGALAQNHQHIFAVRIDPAVDGHKNTVVQEESLPMRMDPKTNPTGVGYAVKQTRVAKSTHIDASPFTNRIIRIQNDSIRNPTSTKPVAYKFSPAPTQLILADPDSVMSKRAKFARHHVWVTKHRDYEFWAGGEFTNQSYEEQGGCFDMAARNDDVENADVVVWNVFGLTHNPRTEDWPVMPMEKHELHIRPSDFFEFNPALDVPGDKNTSSVKVGEDGVCCKEDVRNGEVQSSSVVHLQGDASVPIRHQ